MTTKEILPWKELNSHDWNLYFQSTSLKVKFKGDKEFNWAFLVGAAMPSVVALSIEGKKEIEISPTKMEIDFSLPPSAVYNFMDTVAVFSRRHLRQSKKGLCKDTARIKSIFSFLGLPGKVIRELCELSKTNGLIGSSVFTQPKQLEKLFSERYTPWNKALEDIKSEKAWARAVSPRLSVSIGVDRKEPTLWWRATPVGIVLSEGKIGLSYPELYPEVKSNLPSFIEIGENRVRNKISSS